MKQLNWLEEGLYLVAEMWKCSHFYLSVQEFFKSHFHICNEHVILMGPIHISCLVGRHSLWFMLNNFSDSIISLSMFLFVQAVLHTYLHYILMILYTSATISLNAIRNKT
jgi:hypothetical protein